MCTLHIHVHACTTCKSHMPVVMTDSPAVSHDFAMEDVIEKCAVEVNDVLLVW